MKKKDYMIHQVERLLENVNLVSQKGDCSVDIQEFKLLAKMHGFTFRELDTSYEELRKLERKGYRVEAARQFRDARYKVVHGPHMRWVDFSEIEKLLRLARVSFKAIGTTKDEFYKLKLENDRRFGKG